MWPQPKSSKEKERQTSVACDAHDGNAGSKKRRGKKVEKK